MREPLSTRIRVDRAGCIRRCGGSAETVAALSLARKLAPAGRDVNKLATAMSSVCGDSDCRPSCTHASNHRSGCRTPAAACTRHPIDPWGGASPAAADDNWREIYDLADLIAERHLRTGARSQFLEPPVERLRPASPEFDSDWKERLGAPALVEEAEPIRAFG